MFTWPSWSSRYLPPDGKLFTQLVTVLWSALSLFVLQTFLLLVQISKEYVPELENLALSPVRLGNLRCSETMCNLSAH